jgi:hypothetical protein
MMNEHKDIRLFLLGFMPEEVDDFYHRNLQKYYLLKSDNVKINGEECNDRVKRAMQVMLSKEVLKIEFDKKVEGMDLTEEDFIADQLREYREYNSDNLSTAWRKKAKLYLGYLEKRLEELNKAPEPNDKDISFIIHPDKVKYLDILQNEFKNMKPKHAALLVFAMKDLDFFTVNIHNNKTELYRFIKSHFGDIGARNTFSEWLGGLSRAKGHNESEIEKMKKRIIKLIG